MSGSPADPMRGSPADPMRWSGADGSAAGPAEPAARTVAPPGLALLNVRRLVEAAVVARFPLSPGDQLLVAEGQAVAAGTAIAGRLRDPVVREIARAGRIRGIGGARAVGVEPGLPWSAAAATRRGEPELLGEHLFEVGGRWRVAAGEIGEPVDAPVAGTVEQVRAGMGITLRTAARGLRGAFVLGGPVSGRLELAASAGGELRASGIDVGRAGEILVVGARIDAEALTRARAMGARGVVVGGLPTKERRDFLASEARQRASRQRLPPFAVLVLDGSVRRPIPSPIMKILAALTGRDVAIVGDPPVLAFDDPAIAVPLPPHDLVRIRSGPLQGVEGRWAGLAGLRRFPGGVHLEAGLIDTGDGSPVPVSLGDLERFA